MRLLRSRYVLLATLSYLVFGLVWILLSDQILSMFADLNSVIWLSTAKGFIFCGDFSTGILLCAARNA